MRGKLAAAVVAMALTLAGTPASAETTVGPHVGLISGIADIGKQGTCNNDGTGAVAGGGLSWLPFPVKNVWYVINSAVVLDIPNGVGTANLCGRMTAPMQDTPLDLKALGIGASCLATKGWGGYGTLVFPKGVKWLSNIGWKNSAAGGEVITADVGGQKGKKQDLFVAVATHIGEGAGIGCTSKMLGDKSDPDPFTVTLVYAIIPGAGCDKTDCDKKDPKKP